MLGIYEYNENHQRICDCCGNVMAISFYGFVWVCDVCKVWDFSSDAMDMPKEAKPGEWEQFKTEYAVEHCQGKHPKRVIPVNRTPWEEQVAAHKVCPSCSSTKWPKNAVKCFHGHWFCFDCAIQFISAVDCPVCNKE